MLVELGGAKVLHFLPHLSKHSQPQQAKLDKRQRKKEIEKKRPNLIVLCDIKTKNESSMLRLTKGKTPIVDVNWLLDSISSYCILDMEKYYVR